MTERPNPDLRRKLERQVASLAAAIVAGREPLVASTQRMLSLLGQLGLADTDPERVAFVRISSETDHLPLGSERRHWNVEALRQKDAEIATSEAWARTFGLESCRRLVERFGHAAGDAEAGAETGTEVDAIAPVAVVVDPAFGQDLAELVTRMPVWMADTPGNTAAIQRVRRSGTGSLTSFVVDPGGTPEDWLARVINDVDLHHGEYSHTPAYDRIEVHGTRLSAVLRALLGEFGFHRCDDEPFGFSASRGGV